ncbi:membrane protein [Rhodobacter phage RcKickapoo]|nr:membrane protein [Rhodobacter phage RcKickapoo]
MDVTLVSQLWPIAAAGIGGVMIGGVLARRKITRQLNDICQTKDVLRSAQCVAASQLAVLEDLNSRLLKGRKWESYEERGEPPHAGWYYCRVVSATDNPGFMWVANIEVFRYLIRSDVVPTHYCGPFIIPPFDE